MGTSYIIIGILSMLLFHYARSTRNRVYQRSKDNSKIYLVRQSSETNQIESANLLAHLSKNKTRLCNFVQKSPKYKDHIGIKRLLKYQNVKLEELSYQYNDQADRKSVV